MSRIGECAPCQMGEHERHVKNYDPAPKGMLGGSVCLCEGECVERGPRPVPGLDAIVEMFGQAREG